MNDFNSESSIHLSQASQSMPGLSVPRVTCKVLSDLPCCVTRSNLIWEAGAKGDNPQILCGVYSREFFHPFKRGSVAKFILDLLTYRFIKHIRILEARRTFSRVKTLV